MATKAMNFKLDEKEIADMRNISTVFNITMTDIVKKAVSEYIAKLESDPYYRLTMNVQDASKEESEEVLGAVNNLSDDDLDIASVKHVSNKL